MEPFSSTVIEPPLALRFATLREPFSTVIEAPSELSVEARKGFLLITISEPFSAVRAERLESTEEMNFPVEERTRFGVLMPPAFARLPLTVIAELL